MRPNKYSHGHPTTSISTISIAEPACMITYADNYVDDAMVEGGQRRAPKGGGGGGGGYHQEHYMHYSIKRVQCVGMTMT